jgi:hypothetical protein
MRLKRPCCYAYSRVMHECEKLLVICHLALIGFLREGDEDSVGHREPRTAWLNSFRKLPASTTRKCPATWDHSGDHDQIEKAGVFTPSFCNFIIKIATFVTIVHSYNADLCCNIHVAEFFIILLYQSPPTPSQIQLVMSAVRMLLTLEWAAGNLSRNETVQDTRFRRVRLRRFCFASVYMATVSFQSFPSYCSSPGSKWELRFSHFIIRNLPCFLPLWVLAVSRNYEDVRTRIPSYI